MEEVLPFIAFRIEVFARVCGVRAGENGFYAMDKNAADPGALLKKTKKQKQKKQRLAECARASASLRPSLPNAADATREDILEVAYWRAAGLP